MKIKSFNIYEFGNLAKQSIQDIPSGLLIFLGQNEAGKSTSLEFFRTVLTGFPSSRSKKGREGVFAQKNASMGGFLELETQNADILRLERTLNNFQVYNGKGAQIPLAVYESLLAGTTRDIYSSIYGFSLSELQAIDSLEAQDVRDVLYGTSFGLGLYSPQKSIDYIESLISSKNSKSILGNDTYKNFFKTNCQRLEEIQKLIKEKIEENKAIDIFYEKQELSQSELQSLHENEKELHIAIQALDSKIRAWEHYKEYFLIQKELERLPNLSATFPENGLEKLHRLQDLSYTKIRNTKSLEEKKNKYMHAILEKEHNQKMYDLLPQLQDLLEYKASYRNALIQLPQIHTHILRNEQELSRHLDFLGKNWTYERAEEIDASLFLHEQIEEYIIKFAKSEQSLQLSSNKIESLSQENKMAQSELQKIQQNYNTIPEENSLLLDRANRGILTNLLRRAEESYAKLPEKARAINLAKSEYKRSMAQMRFKSQPNDDTIRLLSDAEASASEFASTVLEQLKKTDVAREAFFQERKRLERLEELHQALTSEHNKHLHLEKHTLYKKRSKIRRIHALLDIRQHNREHVKELDIQYEEIRSQIPITKSNIALLSSALFLTIVGGLFLIAYFIFGVRELDLTFLAENAIARSVFPDLSMQNPYYSIHSTLAFLIFFIGFVGAYLNIPQTNPYRKKKLLELGQAGNRYTTALQKLKTIDEELQMLAEELEIEDLKPDTLLYLEEMLDDEQEQLINKENLMKETFSTEDELKEVRENLAILQKNFQVEEVKSQDLRRQWQENFQKLPIADVPAPEGVEVFFSRINHVRLSIQNVENLEKEVEELKANIDKFYNTALSHFPKISYYKDDVENVFLRVQNSLDQCLEYEKQQDKRQYLKENISILEAKMLNIKNALVEEEERKEKIAHEYSLLQENWRLYLREQKLSDNLSPQSAKTALGQIEKCRETKAKLEELQQDKRVQEEERDKLAKPLLTIFAQLNRTPLYTLDKQIDCLASMDLLYNEAIKAKELFHAKLTIEEQIAQIDDEIHQSQQEEVEIDVSINHLLEEANLTSAEEFEEKARYIVEFQNLNKRKQSLEDTLQFFAGNTSLIEFLATFDGLDLPLLKYKKDTLEKNLEETQKEKEIKNKEIAENKAQILQVESSSLLSDLKEEQISIEEQNEKALKDYLSYAVAKSLIQQAKMKFEKENQPELIKTASEIFEQITDGRWTNISSSIEDGTLYLNPQRGIPHTPEQLSQGTREQLYLALRLAHIKNIASYKEPLPLIFDDILVNFDTLRSTQTAKSLNHFTQTQNQQILFFTCHQHIANILQENVQDATLFTIHEGKINKA